MVPLRIVALELPPAGLRSGVDSGVLLFFLLQVCWSRLLRPLSLGWPTGACDLIRLLPREAVRYGHVRMNACA